MSVPAVRRIVVGVDGSAESAVALRWACREASLRGAEVHAVHAWEAPCRPMASYAVPARPRTDGDDFGDLWKAVLPDPVPGVAIRAEVVPGLPARVLLETSAGADMLVLGTAGDRQNSTRSAGPVIRACLRRSPCPVVVISEVQDPQLPRQATGSPASVPVPVLALPGSRGRPGCPVSVTLIDRADNDPGQARLGAGVRGRTAR
ncbi:MAG TPA: universal stress protein [Trebonia sp.]|jgi:nucleotide-binding universal stress UspA family protein